MNQQSKLAALVFFGLAGASFAWCAAGQQDSFERAAGSQSVLLFGGVSDTGTVLSDTWLWNGKNWQQVFPAHQPPARESASVAYDRARHEVVLFGGASGASLFSDTWVWDGKDWQEKHPRTVPSARSSAGMAYDAARELVILFGGFQGSFLNTGGGETWVWNGEDWQRKSPATTPSARAVTNTMTYDAAIGRIVLFSGIEMGAHLFNSDTWEWDGENWAQQSPSVSPDATLGGFSVAYDAAERKVVAFGQSNVAGSVIPVTWLWDGQNWTRELPPQSPSASGTLAYDRTDRKLLLLDDRARLSSWNGKTWQQVPGAVAPGARLHFALSPGPRTDSGD